MSTVPRASKSGRGLQPIITEGQSWMGWKCSTGFLPLHSSVDLGVYICVGLLLPDSLVRCDVIAHFTASANVGIAPS